MAKKNNPEINPKKTIYISCHDFQITLEKCIFKDYCSEFYTVANIQHGMTISDNEGKILHRITDDKVSRYLVEEQVKTAIEQISNSKIKVQYKPEITISESSLNLLEQNSRQIFILLPIPEDIGCIFSNSDTLKKDIQPKSSHQLIFSEAIFNDITICSYQETSKLNELVQVLSAQSELKDSPTYLVFTDIYYSQPKILVNIYENKETNEEWLVPVFVNGTILPDYAMIQKARKHGARTIELALDEKGNDYLKVISPYDLYRHEIADEFYPKINTVYMSKLFQARETR